MKNKVQLFFLHFAGGNRYSFQFLTHYLEQDYEIHSLELPGRGKRINEKLLVDKKEAILDYFEQIRSRRNDNHYLLIGHSMGATLGLDVTKMMEEINDPPLKLLVTGNPGPGVVDEKKRYLLSDDELKMELRKLGGAPEEVLENGELFDFFSPILRADFELLEKEDTTKTSLKINTPIHAIMGDQEEYQEEIENWNKFTRSSFKYERFLGDHFFIYNYPQELANIINKSNNQLIPD